MPANLSPEYKAAEAQFRKAREPREKLDCLREMLRTIPKHKGTERLQSDIKSRIKDLAAELEGGHRGGGAHGGPSLVIHREGAAQLALVGPPNAGKSLLHARLTGSEAHDAPYPFTTQFPLPGMLPYEDVHFQLVDLPAVSREHPLPWLASTLQSADAALIVVDLSDTACIGELEDLHALMRERRITFTERWNARDAHPDDEDDPFALMLPALLLVNKADQLDDPDAELQALQQVSGLRYPAMAISAATGHGLGVLGAWLFEHLGVVRVYTKLPGHAPDLKRPFTLRSGQTVRDVAHLVHKDVERTLRYARLWGHSGFDGQQVGPEHVLADRDVVELHA